MKLNIVLMTILFAVLSFTVGCSSEPSEAEMKTAIANSMQRVTKSAGELGQMFGKLEVHALKKIGCKEAAESTGYYCDYEIDVTVPIYGRQKGPANGLFVKGKDGWMVMDKK